MVKRISIGVLAILSCIMLYAAFLPADMRISRDLVVNAAPELIYPHINHSKRMNDWMPWQESDPGVKILYSGPEEGVGATSTWDSAGSMGTGNAVVVESIPNQSVKTKLTYTRPMTMSQMAEVSLNPVEGGTKVTWSVECQNGFFFRFMGIFMNVDKMVGGEFEKGLAKLKTIVESA